MVGASNHYLCTRIEKRPPHRPVHHRWRIRTRLRLTAPHHRVLKKHARPAIGLAFIQRDTRVRVRDILYCPIVRRKNRLGVCARAPNGFRLLISAFTQTVIARLFINRLGLAFIQAELVRHGGIRTHVPADHVFALDPRSAANRVAQTPVLLIPVITQRDLTVLRVIGAGVGVAIGIRHHL